ncbi:MAG TPA: zinc ribbon domain-containing protein [Candidatus Methanoperedens sp.]
MKKIALLAVLLIFITGIAHADEGQVVVNSADWVDVYSSIMYANLKGMPYYFVVDEAHARVLPQYMNKDLDVHLVESDTVPYLPNYKNTLSDNGYRVVNETRSPGGRKLNLELGGRLDLKKFIVVDDEYGYNAISVASYAAKSRSWVLFANRDNIDDVYAFLGSRNVESVLLYGHLDRSVSDRLASFRPERIDTGNRFDDNLAVISKYLGIAPSKDIVLTNGDFIEASIMSGETPVMFIGVDTVPSQVIEYLKGTEIKLGTVIGNDIIGSAKMLKDSTGINVIIKFGQGRKNTGGTTLVEELDKFYLPKYELALDAVQAQYNEATKQLELVYRNDAKIGEFYRTSVAAFADGKRITTVGDEAIQYIYAGSESGIAYSIDLTDYARTGNITAQVSTEFGEAPGSLNLLLKKELGVSIISVQDNSEIKVSNLVYDSGAQRLKLMLENTGKVQVYASPDVKLQINGKEETLRLGTAIPLAAGEKSEPSLRVELMKADLADNPQAKVHVAYGERPKLLIKSLDETLQLKLSGDQTVPIIVAVASAIVLLGIVIRQRSKTKAKTAPCANCGETVPGDAKFCPKCGKEIT